MTIDGITVMNNWLCRMPDNTFPNEKIVYTILSCLERINKNDDDDLSD